MRHLPTKDYCGLTIVMSQPSRQDINVLLSGYAGVFFNQDCLAPETSRWRCDIRTADTINEGILPNTRGILLLGEKSLHEWADGYSGYTINEQRGNPLRNRWGITALSSYSPQDAIDPINHEARLNPHLLKEEEEKESTADEEVNTKKRHGRTRRANYRFFLARDVKKILYGMENASRTKPNEYPVNIFPTLETAIEVLTATKCSNFYLDIETDSEQNMLCFGFSFENDSTVYTVPVIRYNYELAYGHSTYRLLKALALAIRANTTVVHNSMFDLYVLSTKYSLPFSWNIYDTMLSQHRCTPGYELVDTVSGRVSIESLVGKENFYVWSWKNGNPYPAKVKKVWKVGKEKVVRVHCWRKMFGDIEKFHIDCTPDHKFLVNSSWIEAKDLTIGTKLTRVNLVYGKENNYDTINYWNTGIVGDKVEVKKAHRIIYEALNGKIPDGYVVHHKDENKSNNSPENLELLSDKDHRALHVLKHNFGGKVPEQKYKNMIDKKTVSREDLVLLYTSGMSQLKIAKFLRTGQSHISRLFKRFKIQSRDLEEAQQLRRFTEKNCRIISVEILEKEEDVFCMEVEDTECYSCNGVIIHNCFPEAEKSLGHCLSSWPTIWEPFHKDEGIFEPRNLEQEKQLWSYNAKDVAAMKWIRRAQLEYASGVRGLTESIEQSNSCIYPFLLNTLLGIRFDEVRRQEMVNKNDRLMNHYQRALDYLTGDKIQLLATSSKSCVRYFHDALGYPIVGRSKKTGEASLDETSLLKLKQKFPYNVAIDFAIKYRQRKKETGSLNFTPWKKDENIHSGS